MPWDSTREVVNRRRRARRQAASERSAARAVDPHIAARLPNYSVDRHALLMHPAVGGALPPPPIPAPRDQRAAQLRKMLHPAARLDGWKPDPDCSTGVGDTYRRLRHAWAGYARRLRLPAGAADLPDASSRTWAEVIDASVFYPGPPVFRGATYLDALPDSEADRILAGLGQQAGIDFYCFMLQVHETLHRYQTGEPLLNEVVQAALWMRFLDEHRLWRFQTGPDGPLVREASVVRAHPMLTETAANARLDTAVLVRSITTDNGYLACCLLARQFDLGAIHYANYLDRLCALLALGDDRPAFRAASLALL